MMAKNIAVIGTGYVGLISAVGLADFGHTVTGVDIDSGVVDSLNKGVPHMFETGLRDYLRKNLDSGRLRFSTDLGGCIRKAEVVFISVGTPAREDGGANLEQLMNAVDEIRKGKKHNSGHLPLPVSHSNPGCLV
jgi:UDPglucose 6-dehydrogenase